MGSHGTAMGSIVINKKKGKQKHPRPEEK